MTGGAGQLIAFVAGVAVAVASFILKEMISDGRAGVRFRKQLTTDLKSLVNSYAGHLSALDKQISNLSATIQQLKTGGEIESGVSMIWDTEFSFLDLLYENSRYLSAEEFREAITVYTILGRTDEIRRRYNDAASESAKDHQCAERELGVALIYLRDMKTQYLQLIEKGSRLLLRVSQNHWFLRVDQGDYEQLIERIKLA